MTGVSILLIGLSVHYAQNISWGRSLFILITGILSFFVPIWQTLTFSHKRDRAFIYGAFGTLLILFILVVGVIRIMQTNIMDYASREMTNKVSYGKTLLETTILSTKTTLSSAAMNPLMVTAMSDKNDKDLLSLSRALFEGNTMFRRVVLVDDKGVAQAVYPYSVQDSTVYGTQNYVIEAFSTKRLVTSDVFDVTADTVKHKGIVIAAPILSATGTVEGVIAGFVDLDTLGNKLEQLASTITGEYFYVVDSMGRVLIHLDKSKIGSLLNLQNQNYVESPSGQNVREEYGSNGTRLLESYAQVGESTGWVVALEVPVAEILLETNAAGITIVAVIILSILIVGMFFLSHRTQVKVAETMVNVRHRIPEPEKPTKPRLSAKHTRVRTDTS